MKQSLTRRELIKIAAKTGWLLPFFSSQLFSCSSPQQESNVVDHKSIAPLKILILGGTSFLGPHQIAYALSRGHQVTTFTRGKTEPTVHTEYFKDVEQLIGDRADNLTALENRGWDLVIDNSGKNADWTKKSATLLKDKSGMYLYTSSTGVYYPYLGSNIDEKTRLVVATPEGIEDEDIKLEYNYGVMKTNSEIETIKAFGEDRSIIVRPTYMMGPADKTDRFIYWPIRLSKGGAVMVPGKSDDPVQYIDVRDVAEWMIRLGEQKKAGTYNAVGPKATQTMYQFVEAAQKAFDVAATFVPIDDYEFLKQNKIDYLIPWIPSEGNNYGSARINNQKGIAAGLTFRPIKDSVKEIYDWWYSDALTDERRAQFELDPQSVLLREEGIINQWRDYNRK